jgi:hypothetical protein
MRIKKHTSGLYCVIKSKINKITYHDKPKDVSNYAFVNIISLKLGTIVEEV